MKKVTIFLLIAVLFLLTACAIQETPSQPSDTDGDNISTDDPIGGTGDSDEEQYEFGDAVTMKNDSFYKNFTAEEKQLYYDLWNENTTVAVKMDISGYELDKINEAYVDYRNTGNSTKADTYRKCNLTIVVNGTSYYYEDVGVRMRGNTSRREFCTNGNIYAPVHFRFSFNETFDGEEYADGAWGADIRTDWTDEDARDARDDRTFATMKKIYYKWNKNYDQTYIRELYANRMFLANGVLAPHITLTQIAIKQDGKMQNFGVGNLYETIDKAFIKRNFDKQTRGGDLYKCSWAVSPANLNAKESYGVETPTQRFNYSLKTNDDRTAADYNHHKDLLAFLDILQKDKNASDFCTALESVLDMDYFTRYEAVNYLLGNPDCIRNNSNNYYLYFTPQGKAYFIPYDYDRCLGANMDWNPSGNSMTQYTPFQTTGSQGDITNPLYTKTVLDGGITKYQDMLAAAINKVLDGKWFTMDNYTKLFDAYCANYADVAMPSDSVLVRFGGRVQTHRFVFSLVESSDIETSAKNLSVQKYLEFKRATAENALHLSTDE